MCLTQVVYVFSQFCELKLVCGIITKLQESGVLCGNITEFGVATDRLSPAGCFVFMPCYPYSFIYLYLTTSLR